MNDPDQNYRTAQNRPRGYWIVFILLALASVCAVICFCVAVSGCSGLDRYDRSYSVSYEDAQGRKLGTGVTIHPRDSKTIKPIR